MKMIGIQLMMIACLVGCSSCEKEELSYMEGDFKVEIVSGDHWLHDFPLFLGISKKNAPQFAIWMEDTEGNYLTTVFVTNKIATEGWQANGGNRRKEALPHWCHQRGVIYEDGLLLPTKDHPFTDGISGATPKEDLTVQLRLDDLNEPIVIKAEFNHSLDFNDFFPENAGEGEDNYSGGKMGSGQPALVYAGTLYPDNEELELVLVGRSSSDGSDGKIYTDLEKISTAKDIIERIIVSIQ
jgi:hypothetical protein